MPLATISVSHEFMFSYIHGLWAKAIRGERLNALIRAENEEQLVQLLRDRGISAEKYDAFHRDLQLREINILSGIREKIQPKAAAFYDAFLKKIYFQNLKTLLHDRYFKERNVNLEFLIVPVPGADIDIKRAVTAEKLDEFVDCLNLGDKRDAFRQCAADLEATRDIIAAECTVDQMAYQNLADAARQLPGNMRDSALELVRQEIDILNVCALFRIVKTYRYQPEQVKTMWLPQGAQLTADDLTGLSQLSSVKEVLAQLPRDMAKPLSLISGGELYLLEGKLWTEQYRNAIRIFRETKNFAQVMVAFPFLQHAETKNIGRIYEGVHFGVQPRDMFDMMIE